LCHKYGSKIIFGQALFCSFCSPETQHFQKNNSFPFFNETILKSAIKVGAPKIYKLFRPTNYVSLIIMMNSNKTTTFVSWISRFFGEKTEKLLFL